MIGLETSCIRVDCGYQVLTNICQSLWFFFSFTINARQPTEIVYICTYWYLLYILEHIDMHCILIIQKISICTNICNEYRYVPICTMNIDMYQYIQWLCWYISIFIVYIGTYRYSLYILVHIDVHCIYWYISIFIVYIGTYRYSLHILVHIDIYCLYWCISISIVYIGTYRYSLYILVHIDMHCTYWCISIVIVYIGACRYLSYILVHIYIHCIINIKEYKLMEVFYYKFEYMQLWMSGQLR